MSNKQEALAAYLECNADDLEQANHDENLFELGMESYLILDDAEADQYTKDRILDSLWAFNPDFILANSRIELDESNEEDILKALSQMLEKLCENANPLVRALLENEDQFIENAISADGRGHFLSSYDNNENEVTHNDEAFFIYRQN